MKLTWRWDSENSNIEIFDLNGLKIGLIPDFNKDTISTIGARKFSIENKGILFSNNYIIDPIDKKAFCEYLTKTSFGSTEVFFKNPSYKRDFFLENKSHCYISENGGFVADFHKDSGWFKSTGKLYINESYVDWELIIYCLFYGLSILLNEQID